MNSEYDLTEVITLEDFSFPVVENGFPYMADIGGHYRCGKSYYTKRGALTESLLLYTREGRGEIIYRDREIELRPGMLLLLDGKYPHDYRTGTGGLWDFFWIHYNDRSPCSLADYFYDKSLLVQKIPQKEFEEFFADMAELSKKPTIFSSMQNSQMLSEFLCRWAIFNMKIRHPESLGKREVVSRAQRYIQENFCSEITVEKLADECSVSKYYFIRIFGETVGMTPHQYLLYVRIGHAKLLLLSTSATVTEIGEKVGFDNTSSFIAAFKKIVGNTPLVFRNKGIEE